MGRARSRASISNVFFGGVLRRPLWVGLALLVAVSGTSGCAYDRLQADYRLQEQRLQDLQRNQHQLENQLLTKAGELKALKRHYSDLQLRNRDLENEMRTLRPVEDSMEESTEVTKANYRDEEQEFGPDVQVTRDSTGELRLTLEQQVLFGAGSAKLSAAGKKTLETVAVILKREHANKTVRVEGHTDNTPVRKARDRYPSNWELSTARAAAVLRALLASSAVEASRAYVVGYGAERPLVANDTKEGRRKNRRVEILILP